MKLFSKILILMFCLMLFWGNNNSCYGAKNEGIVILHEEEDVSEIKINEKGEGKSRNIFCVTILLLYAFLGGIGGNENKNIKNNFCFFTTKIPYLKFLHFGFCYKITEKFYFNILGLYAPVCLLCFALYIYNLKEDGFKNAINNIYMFFYALDLVSFNFKLFKYYHITVNLFILTILIIKKIIK